MILPSPEHAADLFLQRIKAPARLLIAISGGSDSTGLLLTLAHRLARADHPGISLCAATVDHGLRPESADEARQVAALCHRLAIPHHILFWDGEKPHHGLAAAARTARYRLLTAHAQAQGASAILTGHTRNDQAETIAMRAARGGGETIGHSGMAQAVLLDARVWLLRPFLGCDRADIRRYLNQHGEHWIDDPSNENEAYERPRMRRHLALEGRDAGVIPESSASRRRLAERAGDLMAHAVRIESAVLARIDLDAAQTADPAVLRFMMGGLACVLGGRVYRPSGDQLDAMMRLAAGSTPGRMTAGRVLIDRRGSALYMLRERRALPVLSVGAGKSAVWDGRFRVRNDTGQTMWVAAAGPAVALQCPDVPGSLARHAASVLPSASAAGSVVPGGVTFTPVLGGYDYFLPDFDFEFAQSLAKSFGRSGFLSPVIDPVPENAC